jgi:DNA-binding protein Fis
LNLYDNNIYDISPLGNLTHLRTVNLNKNAIKNLPRWITEFNMGLLFENGWQDGNITIYDNPLETPPLEIIKQGKLAIKNYFEQLSYQGKDYLYEAKLMLVGEPGSGKTTLMEKLFDPGFPVPNQEQGSTLGIVVRPNWSFSLDQGEPFTANIWDFGGQQIQYMLHQFFLTPNCVYVLMAEKRRELTNFPYWLNIINILGQNSPIITLFNEININAISSFIYDEKKYKDWFPDLNLQRLDVNLSKIKDGRFDVLVNTIRQQLGSLEHIGQEVPARWVDIRRELENIQTEKYIPIQRYFQICAQHTLEKEADQLLLLRYFHLLGIVLHFSEDENLCDTLFLDPNWTVDAVYSILANPQLERSNGFIKKSEIDAIWAQKGYGFQERAKLLQLVLKDNFELCYKRPGTQDCYIVPLLLTCQKPDYNWDNTNNLRFRFQYPFMPKGILSRLIVRMHHYIADQDLVWSEGAVFAKGNATAQVIEQLDPKEGVKIIEIRSRGELGDRKDLLTLIREDIKRIQTSSFPNLTYREKIPCLCSECHPDPNPYFFTYGDIANYLRRGKTEIPCYRSTQEVPIADLVGSVFNLDEIQTRYQKAMHDSDRIKIDVNPNFNVSPNVSPSINPNINPNFNPNFNPHITPQFQANPDINTETQATQTTTQQQTASQTVSQTISQDLKTVQGLLKNLVQDMLDEVEIEFEDPKETQRLAKELAKAETAFAELEQAATDGAKELPASTQSRIGEFIDNLADENSRINKALKLVSKGSQKLQALGQTYNKVAPYLALPTIPPLLLGTAENHGELTR